MNHQIDITQLSVTELKALKADLYEDLERIRSNMTLLNSELDRRNKEKPEGVK